MARRDDRKAAGVLLLLAVVGFVAKLAVSPGRAPGEIGFRLGPESRPSLDSVAAQAARLARPLADTERIDVDRAPAIELTRLPGIGSALATRIVSHREANGPFGSVDALDEVSGIGPRLLESLRPHIRFSARPIRMRRGSQRDDGSQVRINVATEAELVTLPGIGPGKARAILRYRRLNGNFKSINELLLVSGIGPATLDRLRGRVRVP